MSDLVGNPEFTDFHISHDIISPLPLISLLLYFISIIAWNLHEPYPGVYNFSGQQNITQFFTIAEKYNLSVILRGGPYICGEWEYVRFLLELHVGHIMRRPAICIHLHLFITGFITAQFFHMID